MAGSAVADLVGRVLAGRYRLLGAIGSGASGRVYVADDVRLRRRVAVKVLHAALADDAGFLRRFRSEAQLAASLHHPNVMAVYDWGEDGVPFMVLELLAGGSLRSMLDAGHRFSPAQAAHVGGQVAAALDYAHSRGLVHRDIKPANLLFDEHGIVRVADFGLARALAEASWTEPAGAVVGTARYAAPEQGSGAPLDGRADLYALGLVVVESVTGSVPLTAETALGTLNLRQTGGIEVPAAMGPLGPIVARACESSPDDRYPTADAMRLDLADAAETLPPPGPLILTGIGAMGEDPHPTQIVRPAADSPLFDQDQAAAAAVPRTVATARMPDRSRSFAPLLLGALIVVAVAAVAFVLAQPKNGPSRPVPLLVGEMREEAEQRAFENDFLVDVERVAARDPRGVVVSQDPPAGEFLAEGRSIRLQISKGPEAVRIPELAGKTVPEAEAALGRRFAVEAVDTNDDVIKPGVIIRSEPTGKAQPDSLVKLFVSTGPKVVRIPSVAGDSYEQAAVRLRAAGFEVARVDAFHPTAPIGEVVGTEPAARTRAPRRSTVRIVVSKGPDLVEVPNFVGRTITEATALAELQGVELQASGTIGRGRRARAQAPPPGGEKVPRGTVVTIFF